MRMHGCRTMEIDNNTSLASSGNLGTGGVTTGGSLESDEKRVKRQPPPSHFNLLTQEDKNQLKGSTAGGVPGFNSHAGRGVSNNSVIMDLIDANDFETCDDNTMQYFMKQSLQQSLSAEEVAEVAASSVTYREDTIARADICPKIRRPRLRHGKGLAMKIKDQYGYEISNTTYLYAEEALYLIEIGKLLLFLNKAPVSVERARALLLHSKGQEEIPNKVKSCSVDEYVVYKHLLRQGYRLYRRDVNNKPSLNPGTNDPQLNIMDEPVNDTCEKLILENEDVSMDIDTEAMQPQGQDFEFTSPESAAGFLRGCSPAIDTIVSSPSSSGTGCCLSESNSRGVKRKYDEFFENQGTGYSTPTSSAKDNSDNEDADVEFDCLPVSDACMDSMNPETLDTPILGNYTVTEADSDVEICDDSQTPGVQIEEIGYDYDGDVEDEMGCSFEEPKPSTSTACFPTATEGLVDLARSDSEEEEEVKLFTKVWSKLVPNATIQIGFPPETLLPSGIPFKNAIYEFDVKPQSDNAHDDSDLEYYVDELNLNSSPGESDDNENTCTRKENSQVKCKSWKEWKKTILKDATNVLQDSLLAPPADSEITIADTPVQRLNLWKANGTSSLTSKPTSETNSLINLVYDLYHPTTGTSLPKLRLKKEYQPGYIVGIVRNDDVFPCLTSCDSLSQNGIPILVAVVSDETDMIFMKPDRSPIPSFF